VRCSPSPLCFAPPSLGSPRREDRPPEQLSLPAEVLVAVALVQPAELGCIGIVRIFLEPFLDGSPVQRLVSIPVVVRRVYERVQSKSRGSEAPRRLVEPDVTAVVNPSGQRPPAPVGLADDDVPAVSGRRSDGRERPCQARPR
jgi:hypothetical protein